MKIHHFLLALLLSMGTQPVLADVTLEVSVVLQGAYDRASGLMRTDLRDKNLIPVRQPYAGEPFNYAGTETVAAAVLAQENERAAVDWVLLELYAGGDTGTALARRAVMLLGNGQVVDAQTGASRLTFAALAPGNYQVAVRHRNHLGLVSQVLALEQNATLVDFSNRQAGDTSRHQEQERSMLWAGDANADRRVIGAGPGTDVSIILGQVLEAGGNTGGAANYVLRGYLDSDLNLDGMTVFAGPGTDIARMYQNLLLHPGNTTRSLNYIIENPESTLTTVVPPAVDPSTLNLAQLFGQASQGADYNSFTAVQAIDGDPSTMNHTGCNATDNWWQVQLPDPTSVSRIVVTGRSTFTTRLQDAGVYLGSAPYGGTLDEAERVFTLSGTAAAQEVVLPTPRNAAYLIIKAAADNCLHLSEVAVYGAAPAAPTLTVMDSLYRIALAPIHDNAYLLPHASPVGTLLGAVRGADYQQDRLSYRIESSAPVPFVIDAQGRIVTSAALTPGATHDFRVVVSDGANTAFVSFMAGATELDAVEQSLAGEQLFATDEELLDAALATITASRNLLLDARIRLFNLNPDGSARTDGSSLTALDWNPTHDAALLQSTYGMNIPVLTTNGAGAGYAPKAREIGIAGADPARYLVLGGNPLRNAYRDSSTLNDPMHQWLENSLSWLSGREDLKTTPFQAVIAHLHDNVYFPDERAVRSWLDQHYPGQVSYNAADTCDDVALATCLEAGPDLLILSQYPNAGTDPAAIAAVVTAAMQRGIPVLYLHLDGDMTALGNALLPLFNVSYLGDNYWHRLLLSGFDATSAAAAMPDNIRAIQTLLQHFRAGDYAFDWSACKGEDCSAVPGLDTEFAQGAGAVRSMLGSLDSAGVRLFERTGFRLQKLLVLLGQGYARRVHFPMDKVTTDDNAFMRSLFVDHAAYYQRAGNVPQADLGNFGRSDFSHITPVSKTVNLESKVNFRSVGVYVLPGVPVSVTRLDHSDTAVKVFVNTQRSTATHEWAANGYTRPKYLQSPSMVVNSGETLRFTSPYGGLLQAAFSANDLPVQLQVENVGEHPYWRSSADDAGFAAGLAAGDYDWAELATPGFEVHSTLGRMRESVSNWGDAASLAARTMRYLHNFPHQLAGFQGPGIDAVAEIHDFASTNGLTISTLDMVKHMNADQATCGTGCSGNPYDAYWAFSPVSHGDIHELGHGLEKDRFRFSGWEGHSTTNPYSYYTKTQYFKDTGADPACQTLPFESVFNTLQASVSQTDPQAWLQANLWASSNWSQQVSMTLQMMMATQYHGKLTDGWHLLARLHILEREFSRARRTEADWAAAKAGLGMPDYTLAAAQAISNNDWLVVSISWASGLDFRDYLRMWGQPFSTVAAAQVAAFGYPAAERRFFISSPNGFCKGEGFDGVNLPVDGTQVWP